MLLFAVIILVPAAGYRWLHWNPILAFWFAYVITRPLGASFADRMGKPKASGGLGFGNGPVSIVLAVVIAGLAREILPCRQPNRHPATDS